VRLAATLEPPPAPRPADPAPPLPAVPPPPPATSALSAAAAPVIPAPPAGDARPTEMASVEAPAAAERSFGLENASSRILLKARNDSWVQIRDTLEKRFVMTRLLRTGDSYQVPDIPGLVLKTGNAGALDVFVDGAAVPPLGAIGAVKSITLEPDKLVQGQAAAN
jgi:cytoskeleton protein RodZ